MSCVLLAIICMVFKHLCCSVQSPDVILRQEHWLTPANLQLLSDNIASHYSFDKSAIDDRVTLGPLVGRPYGGAAILIKMNYRWLLSASSVQIGMLLLGLAI